jgi:RNA polymerase nonessential primary-like sigma factor
MNAKLLTHDEEVALGIRARDGDLDARNKLVECNLGIACSLAIAYGRRCHCNEDDLKQAAYLGLVQGANVYDPVAYQNSFMAIAKHYIRKELLAYLYGRPMVRVTHNMRPGEMKNHPLSSRKKKWKSNLEWAIQCALRAGTPMQRHEDQDLTTAQFQVHCDAEMCRDEDVEMLRSALLRLPKLHEDVLRRRFGLGVLQQTARSVARDFGTSHQTILNIQKRAIAKLRQEIA